MTEYVTHLADTVDKSIDSLDTPSYPWLALVAIAASRVRHKPGESADWISGAPVGSHQVASTFSSMLPSRLQQSARAASLTIRAAR